MNFWKAAGIVLTERSKQNEAGPGEACRGNGCHFYDGAFLEMGGVEGSNGRRGEIVLIGSTSAQFSGSFPSTHHQHIQRNRGICSGQENASEEIEQPAYEEYSVKSEGRHAREELPCLCPLLGWGYP